MANPDTTPYPTQGRPSSVLDPVAFKLLFTTQERVDIYTKAKTDYYVWDFLAILDDPRLKLVDRTNQNTIDALDYLVSQGLLTELRKNIILGI